MTRPRDTQRQKIYGSGYDGISKAAEKFLERSARVASTGNVSTEACQAYVDDLTSTAWFQRRWGRRHIDVRHKVYGNATGGNGRIALPPWARDEPTILHEIAHVLTSDRMAAHGPEYAGVFLTLVRLRVGTAAAQSLRESFKQNRVRYNMDAVPEPTREVLTKAKKAARKTAAASRPTTNAERVAAAEVIRRAVKSGHFGPSGRKPREHALATARALEGKIS